jgi:hypothetical protein
MSLRFSRLATLANIGVVFAFASTMPMAGAGRPAAPLAFNTARVTIAGTSNIHAFTASTTEVRVTRAELAPAVAGSAFWEEIVKPGGLRAFEIAVAAATLSSPKEGLDKNMHKALKVQDHPQITFRVNRIEPGADDAVKAIGVLQITGVEREVVLPLKVRRDGATLSVKGELQLLMTDYGIKPPTAMLGMLKTDPKVTVTFETVLAVPLT